MRHKYSVGQLVYATDTRFADRTGGVQEVIRLMPESNGELGYRIKNATNGAQRAVGESEIRACDTKQAAPAWMPSSR